MEIAVVDYGMGNLRSVLQALMHAAPEAHVRLAADPARIAAADRVVFPGQGAMRDCMRELEARNLRAAVLAAAREKPFFGICVGAQLLFDHSEEGNTPGLGHFAGTVRHFGAGLLDAQGRRLKVPHMGWNRVRHRQDHPLWQGIPDGERFYFVHSYYMCPDDASIVVGESEYPTSFAATVAQGSLFATQFHPEKSHRAGLQLLANFARWHPA